MIPSRLLTSTRLRDARACPELDRIKYVAGIKPIRDSSQALQFGILLHQGLESWWKPLEGSARNLDVAMAFMKAGYLEAPLLDGYTLVKAEELLRGYHFRWCNEPYTNLAVEQQFDIPFHQEWRLAGKVDAIARDADGKHVIVEHKTTSENINPGSAYWRKLVMDPQISQYFIGAKAMGYEPAYCVYDVLARPNLMPRTATPDSRKRYTKGGELYATQRTTSEPLEEYRLRLRADIASNPAVFYQRGTIYRHELQQTEYLKDVGQYAFAMALHEQTGRAPKNPDACWRWNRACGYYDACCGSVSLDDPERFEKADPHPELTGRQDVTE